MHNEQHSRRFALSHNEPQYCDIKTHCCTCCIMLFTPPFVEGWRSKQRLQNRKACARSCSISLEHSKYHPKTQLALGDPKKRALLRAMDHALKIAYSTAPNTLLDIRLSVSPPQKEIDRRCRRTQVGATDPYPSLLPGCLIGV